MALPCPLSPDELAAMRADALFVYFAENARYLDDAPHGSQYAIRFGAKPLCSGDTYALRKAFVAHVRAHGARNRIRIKSKAKP